MTDKTKMKSSHSSMGEIVDEETVKQLALFTESNVDGNTLVGYDIRPRFIHTRRSKVQTLVDYGENGDKIIKLEDGTVYSISPAVIDRDGSKVAIFPGTRESLVEEAIMSFASNRQFDPAVREPGYTYDSSGLKVIFTLYQLWNHMAKNSKTYNYSELHEALLVLKQAGHYKGKLHDFGDGKLRKADGYGSYITGLVFIDHDSPDMLNVKVDKFISVRLNEEATKLILEGKYKLYDDQMSMKMQSPMARFLYKKIIQQVRYNPAEDARHSIQLKQNESILVSGYQIQNNATKRRDAFTTALKELVRLEVLCTVDESLIETVKEGRAIVELVFTVDITKKMFDYLRKVYERDLRQLEIVQP